MLQRKREGLKQIKLKGKTVAVTQGLALCELLRMRRCTHEINFRVRESVRVASQTVCVLFIYLFITYFYISLFIILLSFGVVCGWGNGWLLWLTCVAQP